MILKAFVFFGLLLIPFLVFGQSVAPVAEYPLDSDSPVWKGQITFRWTSSESGPFYIAIDNVESGEQDKITVPGLSYTTTDLPLGEYRWRVATCKTFISNCTSSTEIFNVIPPAPEVSGGLIPCGTKYDNPTTRINESDPCGFQHLFILLQNVLNFVIWQLGLLVIAVMAVITGAITYFSFGSPNTIIQIKSIGKSLFVGYFLLIFAWLINTVILNLLGFKAELFGGWWFIVF